MSYNISSTETPVLDAWMMARDIVKLYKKLRNDLPENCFLENLRERATDAILEDGDQHIAIDRFSWSGYGHSHEILVKQVAPKVMGKVDVIFTWEGGDSFSGLQIRDGEVTECDVVMTLKPKAKK